MAKDLKENFRKAPLWVTIEQGAGRLVRVSASILLARILVPEDFGVYALSLSILEMARMFGNIGIGTTVIQSSDEPDEHLNSAFWINLCASVFMFVCSIACGCPRPRSLRATSPRDLAGSHERSLLRFARRLGGLG